MTVHDKHAQLLTFLHETRHCDAVNQLIDLDTWTKLPKKGQDYRAKTSAYFQGKIAELWQSDQARKLASYFEDADLTPLSDAQKAGVRIFLEDFAKKTRVPLDMQVRYAGLVSTASVMWKQAVKDADYGTLKPYLKQLFEMTRDMACLIFPGHHPHQSLVLMSEPGADTGVIDRLFHTLREGLKPIHKWALENQPEVDDTAIHKQYDVPTMIKFQTFLASLLGYDLDAGAYAEILHPFSSSVGPHDMRFSSSNENLRHGIFSAMHEAGHAAYGQRSSGEAIQNVVWGGCSGSFHEGQAKFFENILGRSAAFWDYAYPHLQRFFPEFESVSKRQFVLGINRIGRSPRRLMSDELTYNLHPIIRYELERELCDGTLSFDDLHTRWNEKYEELLGVTPKNDAEGILQDMHWAGGLWGYFQNYTLGNLYDGQMWHCLKRDVPGCEDQMRAGDLSNITTWLTENIHQHAQIYLPDVIIKRVSGEGLSAGYYLDYLKTKLEGLYA